MIRCPVLPRAWRRWLSGIGAGLILLAGASTGLASGGLASGGLAGPQARVTDRLAWRVAPGIAAPAAGVRPPRRRQWCDLGKQVAAALPAPFKIDPIFHRPPERLRGQMAVALKEVELSRPGSAAERAAFAKVASLMHAEEGPALARVALLHPGSRGRTAALVAARPLMAQHPRLVGFVAGDLKAKEPARASAAVRCALAARCDTPAVYAMDGLDHPAASVREAALRGALRTAETLADRGLMRIVAHHITTTERLPRLRAMYARGVGLAGWAPGTSSLQALLGDKSALVRSEAEVALARILGHAKASRWAKERGAAARMAAIRALAAARTTPRLIATLRGWRRDRRRVADPLGAGPQLRVGEAAAEALAWHGVR